MYVSMKNQERTSIYSNLIAIYLCSQEYFATYILYLFSVMYLLINLHISLYIYIYILILDKNVLMNVLSKSSWKCNITKLFTKFHSHAIQI